MDSINVHFSALGAVVPFRQPAKNAFSACSHTTRFETSQSMVIRSATRACGTVLQTLAFAGARPPEAIAAKFGAGRRCRLKLLGGATTGADVSIHLPAIDVRMGRTTYPACSLLPQTRSGNAIFRLRGHRQLLTLAFCGTYAFGRDTGYQLLDLGAHFRQQLSAATESWPEPVPEGQWPLSLR